MDVVLAFDEEVCLLEVELVMAEICELVLVEEEEEEAADVEVDSVDNAIELLVDGCIPVDDAVTVVAVEAGVVVIITPDDELETTDVLDADQVMYGSVVSASASEKTDCCNSYQEVAEESNSLYASPIGVAEITWLPVVVVTEALIDTEQPVTVEHERVNVDVDAVVAPVGVNTEYEVSHALVVCVEHELLELVDVV